MIELGRKTSLSFCLCVYNFAVELSRSLPPNRLDTPLAIVNSRRVAVCRLTNLRPRCLSVGCHVLAHESFEDELTAQIMNEYYVNIKVHSFSTPEISVLTLVLG